MVSKPILAITYNYEDQKTVISVEVTTLHNINEVSQKNIKLSKIITLRIYKYCFLHAKEYFAKGPLVREA